MRRFLFGCKWTPRAIQSAALARKEAATLLHESVQDTHFTIALGHLGEGFAAERLRSLGFDHGQALALAKTILGSGTKTMESTTIPFGESARHLIADAQDLSLSDGLWYFGSDHLFLALLQRHEKLLVQLIERKGLTPDAFLKETEEAFRAALKEEQAK